MRVAIYSPYLDTFGGGEKYMMTIGEILSLNSNVDVLLDQHLNTFGRDYLKRSLQERFSLNLSKVNFILAPVGKNSAFFQRLMFTKSYDLLFYLTDGSIFISLAGKNILHIQSPLAGQPAKSFWGNIKLRFWNLIIYNSEFTKKNAAKFWPLKSEVIYPPVDVNRIKPLKKKKYILSVGRFFGYLKDKKHSILIRSFRELYKNEKMNEWSLHLAGAVFEGDMSYLDELKRQAGDLPINFYPNISYDDLVMLYGVSSIYWHAAGFDEEDPAKMEHFGISTVEAMSGGCVPVVIGKGGQVEIVQDRKSGLLWQSLDQLEKLTLELVDGKDLWAKLSKGAIARSMNFNKEQFNKRILDIAKD